MKLSLFFGIVCTALGLAFHAQAQELDYGRLMNLWPLNGNTADHYGTNDGTFAGTATYTTGPRTNTQAASLNGSSYIKAGTNAGVFDLDTAFSAGAWIKGASQDSAIIGKMVHGGAYTGWELHVSGAPIVWLINQFGPNFIQVNSTRSVLDNQWHYVAFTYDGTATAAGVRIYVDGLDATGTTSADNLSGSLQNSTALNVGSRQDGAAHRFTGAIAEASVWDKSLSAQEMSTIYQQGINPPLLIAYFMADDAQVHAGQAVTLSWQVDPSATVTLDQGIRNVTSLTTNGLGAIAVVVETNSTFLLTATKSGGQTLTKSVAITIKPLITSFAVSRNPLPRGAATTLSWAINPLATNVSITPSIGSVSGWTTNGIGSLGVTPVTTTTYTMTVERNGGSQQLEHTVTVNEPLPAAAPDLADLVSLWPLNGNTRDAVGFREGQFMGNTNYSAGPEPGTLAAQLEAGSYIQATPSFTFDQGTPFSATAWVRGEAAGNDTAIFGQMSKASPSTGWELHVGAPEVVAGPGPGMLNLWLINAFGTSYIQVNSTNLVLDGTWHHVAFTYDGTSTAAGVHIYVDGQDSTGTAAADFLAGPFLSSPVNPCIGSREGTANFNGAMGGVSVWNTNLSPENVASIYQSGVPLPSLLLGFSADNYLVYPGQSVKLGWQVATGAAVVIDQGVGEVTSSTTNGVGSIAVTVQAPTTFTLTATKQGRSETRQVTVNTKDVLTSFKADRLTIPQGGSALLSWVVSPLAAIELAPGVGSLSGYTTNGTGSLRVTPATTTTYNLSASYAGTTVQRELTITVTPSTPATPPALAQLVSLWPLDADTRDAFGGHDAEFMNLSSFMTGPLPGTGAANLVGTNWIVAESSSEPEFAFENTSPFSATAWIKGEMGQDTTIISKMQQFGTYAGWELHVGAGAGGSGPGLLNVWIISIFGPNYIQVNSPQVVLDGTWHHVAFTYEGSSTGAGVRIYVDGEDATGNITADSLTGSILNTARLTVGARDNGAFHQFQGAIHETSLWKAALTPENIRYIYAQGVPVPPTIHLSEARFAPPSNFSFSWNSVAGAGYQIEVSTNLTHWTAVQTNYPPGGATSPVTTFTNTVATRSGEYYRVGPAR